MPMVCALYAVSSLELAVFQRRHSRRMASLLEAFMPKHEVKVPNWGIID